MGHEPKYPWRFDTNARYREVVRTLMGLATASLLLPVFFAREFLGVPSDTPLNAVMRPVVYVSWGFLALAVLSGVIFHYLSGKWVRLAWGQDAGFLWFKLSDVFVDRALDVSFWATVAGLFVGVALTVKFFLTFTPV